MFLRRFRVSVTLLLALSLALLAGPASAGDLRAEDDVRGEVQAQARQARALAEQVFGSDDPASAFEALGTRDRALLLKGVEVVEHSDPVVVSADASIMSPGCWTVSSYVYGSNALGNHLYRYWMTIDWCINTSNQVYWGTIANRWAETLFPGWSFDGHIQAGQRTLTSEYRAYSQGKFVLGAGGWDIQEARPCIQLRGYWNATANVYASCAI